MALLEVLGVEYRCRWSDATKASISALKAGRLPKLRDVTT